MNKFTQLVQLKIPLFYFIIFFLCAVDYEKKLWKQYSNIFGVITISICVYGLFSYVTATNYLSDILSTYYINYDIESMNDFVSRDARFGLQRRLSGTATNPIPYGIMLVIWIGYLYGIKETFKSKQIVFILILLCISNLILTGSRGPIAALVLFYSFLYFKNTKKIKRIVIIAFLLTMLFICYPFISSFLELNNDIGGSSFDMRLVQAEAALSIVSSNVSLIWGHGLGFVNYYIDIYGTNVDTHSFESVLLSGLVETGIYGIIFIFLGKIFVLWQIARRMKNRNYISLEDFQILCAFLIMHMTYCILVGDSYTLLFYSIYFLLIRYFMFKHNTFPYAKS